MLPRTQRISLRQDFDFLFQKGRTVSSTYCAVRWLKTTQEASRFGFIVSNKISKKATVRNQIKRRLRAVVQKHFTHKNVSCDVIIIAKPSIVNAPYEDLEKDLVTALSRIYEISATLHSPRVPETPLPRS